MAAEMISLMLPLHCPSISLTSPEKGVNGASHRNDITPQPFSLSCPLGHLNLTYPSLSKRRIDQETEKVKGDSP